MNARSPARASRTGLIAPDPAAGRPSRRAREACRRGAPGPRRTGRRARRSGAPGGLSPSSTAWPSTATRMSPSRRPPRARRALGRELDDQEPGSWARPPRWPAGMRTGWLPIPSHPRGTKPCRARESARRHASAAGHGQGRASGQAGRQDAEHGAARVDQRAAREARVRRRVGPDVLLEEPAARAGRAADRAHDAHARHELAPARAAHGEDELPHAGGSRPPAGRARSRGRARAARRDRSRGRARRAGRGAPPRSSSRRSDHPRARWRGRRPGRASSA